MIDFKSATNTNTSPNDAVIERFTNVEGAFSLTWLWEVIVRTKRLPDDLDPQVLFIILRDRLRNPEREVRQHALRVLADLIPVIDGNLDKHMELILPDLTINLSYMAPSVRKGTIDVLRIYIKHSLHKNEILRNFVDSVKEDSHLMHGVLMAIPYFTNLNEETLLFLVRKLLNGLNQEFLRETSLNSLVKLRSKLGKDRFNHLVEPEALKSFHELCQEQNIHLAETDDDNVILETEIQLETGPAITMKIHEEIEHENFTANPIRHSKSDTFARSPRKVRFGGEVVKMRTPESDSNHQSSDDTDVQTNVFIDRPTSIKITVQDGVTAIKTRHKSMIPIRITTGSTPSTPQKKMQQHKRLHKSAPELRKIHQSKIPLKLDKIDLKKSKSTKNLAINNNNVKGERKSRALIKEPPKGRPNDSLSPIPVHNEIELFHNLTRSPDRSEETKSEETTPKKEAPQIENDGGDEKSDKERESGAAKENYPSFQVCNDSSPTPNQRNNSSNNHHANSPLNNIVRDLIHKEDTWTRNRALDDFLTLIGKNKQSLDDLNNIPQFIEALFACHKQKRLQNKAQEVLELFISRINGQKLQESLKPLCAGLTRTKPPQSVRLAILVMEKSTPRQFLNYLPTGSESNREGMLQILIAAARTFPSSEIDVIKGTQLAFEAMTDSKRAVRQAALEALASLAQVAGNTMILHTITEMVQKGGDNGEENAELLGIVRTRLSRRQLPTVDNNGNVRYSSPREQEEFDWLCSGGGLSKTLSLNSVKTDNGNNWRRNQRHSELLLKSSTSLDYSQDELNGKDQPSQWASQDENTFPKIPTSHLENATLCPVYVLHRDSPQLNGKSYRHFDRGRSNSPPSTRQQNTPQESKRFFRQHENHQFKKSFSSEHIYGKLQSSEAGSFSLSSRSSTTSTGSSTRSGLWLRDFRSGIPIPITDPNLKVRSHRDRKYSSNGPMLAQEPVRTKLEIPQSAASVSKNNDQLIPPPSSGSESSGYFTPPSDHLIKEPPVFERLSSEENNNFESNDEPDFQIVDSENEAQSTNILRESSASSDEASRRLDEIISEELNQHQKQQDTDEVDQVEALSPLEDVDFDETSRNFAPRSKSRTEVGHHKNSLPEIHAARKNINSAPPLNDMVALVPWEPSPVKTSLPGSVTSNENTPIKSNNEQEEKEQTCSPKRLIRRSLSLRNPSSVKRFKSPGDTNEFRPFTRPKEALAQSLIQMDSCEWEIVIQGLNNLVRLCRNHPESLDPHMHSICTVLAKNIKNLRSQVARNACMAANELFCCSKRGLDMELEELAGPLLHRTADTNKFLRSDANAALDSMSLNLSIPRVVSVVTNKGSTHQNGIVRGCATRLLSDIAMRIGTERVYQLPKEIRDKFLLVGANGLTEGSLETRKYAKALMGTLAKHYQFQKALVEAVPHHTVRHITKIINSLK